MSALSVSRKSQKAAAIKLIAIECGEKQLLEKLRVLERRGFDSTHRSQMWDVLGRQLQIVELRFHDDRTGSMRSRLAPHVLGFEVLTEFCLDT